MTDDKPHSDQTPDQADAAETSDQAEAETETADAPAAAEAETTDAPAAAEAETADAPAAAEAEAETADAPAAAEAAEAKPEPAPTPAAVATAAEEPASLLPLIGVVALILIGLVAGQMLGGVEPESELTAEQLILQGNKQPTAAEAIPFFKRAIEVDPEHDHPQAHAALGRAHAFRNEFEPALEHLIFARDHSAPGSPAPPEVHLLIGMSYLGLERFEEALEPLEISAAGLPPQDYRPHYYLAMCSMYTDKPAETARHLERMLGNPRVPDPSIPYRWYAQAMDRLGRPDDAIAALNSLTLIKPKDVAARYDLQRRRIDAAGYPSAVEQARAQASDEGATAMDRYVLAWLLTLDHRSRAEGRELLDAVRAEDPSASWVSLTLANERLRDGDLEASRLLLEASLLADPTYLDAETKLALVLRMEGKFEQAREIYAKLSRSGATFVAQQETLNTHIEEGQLDVALAFAKDQTRLTPVDSPDRLLEAKVLQARGDFAAARALLARILESRPESDRLVWQTRIGLWALDAGEDSAAGDLQSAIQTAAGPRQPPDLLLWAGVAAYAAGDSEGARALWSQGASSGREQDPEALYTYGFRRLLGTVDGEVLRQAAQLGGPRHANDAWFLEGLARELAGDSAGALEAYRKSVEVSQREEFPARLAKRAVTRLE